MAEIKFFVLRQTRLLRRHAEAVYHCVSRVVDKRYAFGDAERRKFHSIMRRLEEFCGVQVLTYCLMSNHFHLLVRVPEKAAMPALTEEGLRDLITLIYRRRRRIEVLQELDRARQALERGDASWMNEILARYEARRYDLSSFIKDLKQWFTQWYNHRHDRQGTLWEGRFKSVLVENGEQALLTIGAYIDLNPVRAGLVDDPKDFRWSGYGEAVAGKTVARKGLCAMLNRTRYAMNRRITWADVGPKYRLLIYVLGEGLAPEAMSRSRGRSGPSHAEVEEVRDRGGELGVAKALRGKVRYFCDGAVIGGKEFVEEVFGENRWRYGVKRRSGARRMRGTDWGELRVLRDLRQNLF